jgi:phage tail sheath gpL-like
MDDDQIHETITKLVDEEHHLRSQPEHSDDQRAQLAALEESLDQCWDLLRQRDALRHAGSDPSAAAARPAAEVEGYLQ